MALRLGLDILQQNTGLNTQGALGFVKLKDLVHSLDRQDNAARYGDRAADLTRACASDGHGHIVFIADFEDCRHILDAVRLDDGIGSEVSAGVLVVAEISADGIAREHTAFSQSSL